MDSIARTQRQARSDYKMRNGNINRIDLSGYSECSKRAYMRAWNLEKFKDENRFKFLRECEN